MSAWELTNVTARIVLPPGSLVLFGLAGLGLMRSWPRTGRGVALFSLLSLYALSLPIVGGGLVRAIEVPYADPASDVSAGAIVVLGGGTYARAPEYGGDTVSRASLERIRYAAYLQRRTRKPILVTGGNPLGGDTTEGAQMQAALSEFGTSAAWVEAGSDNTLENARLTFRMLERTGVKTIYLVTHAWHMPRARMAFERAGFNVVAAPIAYRTHVRVMPLDFVPNARALEDSAVFFHEFAGLTWYRLQFAAGR